MLVLQNKLAAQTHGPNLLISFNEEGGTNRRIAFQGASKLISHIVLDTGFMVPFWGSE